MNKKKSIIITSLVIFLAAILVNVVYVLININNDSAPHNPIVAAFTGSSFDGVRDELVDYVNVLDDTITRRGDYVIMLDEAEYNLRNALRQYTQADIDLERAIFNYSNEIEELYRLISRQKIDLDALNEMYETISASDGILAQSLRMEIDRINAEIITANATVTEYEDAIDSARRLHEPRIKSYRNRVEGLVDAQLSLEYDIARFRNDIISNQAHISDLLAQIQELDNDVTNASNEVNEIQNLIQTRDDLIHSVDEMLSEIDQAIDTITVLRGQIEDEKPE